MDKETFLYIKLPEKRGEKNKGFLKYKASYKNLFPGRYRVHDWGVSIRSTVGFFI